MQLASYLSDPLTLISNVRITGSDGLFDISIADGRIADIEEIGTKHESPPSEHLNGEGLLAVPAFIDGHLHLDKTFLGADWVSHTGQDDVASRIREERRLRKELQDSMPERARLLAETVLSHGTTGIRTHVDIDDECSLSGIEAILELREDLAEMLDIQIVAFPQSGLFSAPTVMRDMISAAGLGIDAVGSVDPTLVDGDLKRSLDTIFDLAERFDLAVDIHLHERGEIGMNALSGICARAKSLGLQGKVTVSHGFCLADIDETRLAHTADEMRNGGVSLMSSAPGAGALVPIRQLHTLGVDVFSGSDNIRDAWAPFGNGDMLDRARLLAYRGDFRTDALLRLAFDCATTFPARILGFSPRSLSLGDQADLVLLTAQSIEQSICDAPASRRVIRKGRLVVQNRGSNSDQ